VGAQPGLRADVTAPRGTSPDIIRQAPPGGEVVAWTLIADPDQPGGAVVEPVFLAKGRAWTLGQYRAAFGHMLDVTVTRRA
jgi:hypothetical protein